MITMNSAGRLRSATCALSAMSLLLAGCGATGTGDDAGETKAAAGEPASWKASDACTILDKGSVGAMLKLDVVDATISLVSQAGAAEAATSECSYIGSDGAAIATMQARWSPIADNTAEAIASAKSTTEASVKAFTDLPVEDVPGIGQAAFFVPGINQLQVFFDESRMIVLTLRKLPEGAVAKDVAVALARQAGG